VVLLPEYLLLQPPEFLISRCGSRGNCKLLQLVQTAELLLRQLVQVAESLDSSYGSRRNSERNRTRAVVAAGGIAAAAGGGIEQ